MPIRLLILMSALFLAACGGGSGSGSGAGGAGSAPTDAPPTAVASVSATTVVEGDTVTLDGTGSRDDEGRVALTWVQVEGPIVEFEGLNDPVASFVAPEVAGATTIGFELTVTDDAGQESIASAAVMVEPAVYALSGTVTAAPGSASDSDTNAAGSQPVSNDTPAEAQAVANLLSIGGYVAVAGAGRPGAIDPVAGDEADFYRVTLERGQTVALTVADSPAGDPDLYLWSADGANVIDSSLSEGAFESLTVPALGEYLIEVSAYDGASNYVLILSRTAAPGIYATARLSDDFVAGEMLLERASGAQMMGAGLSALGVRPTSAATGRPVLARIAPAAGGVTERSLGIRAGGIDHAAAIADPEVRAKYQTLLAIKAARRTAGVRHAEPNFRVNTRAGASDPHFPLQWHYDMIDLAGAWDVTRGAADVNVAVLDNGVLADHPDLIGQLYAGYDFVADPARAGDGDGLDGNPADPGQDGVAPSSFHGTHVTGTVVAAADNGVGGTGVAPGARVTPVRVLGADGSGTSYDVVQGMLYAAGLTNDAGVGPEAAVNVMNLSLGRSGGCSVFEQAVIDTARAAGIVIVAAAGNEGIDAADAWPATCAGVLTVAAVDMYGDLAPYSNHGTNVDVRAPGGRTADDVNGDGFPDGVLSTLGDDAGTELGYKYGFLQGTSMAAPHVAGVIALMVSANPHLTPADVDNMLANGELTDDRGVINAGRAVFAATSLLATPPALEPRLAVDAASFNFAAAYNYAEFEVIAEDGPVAVTDVASDAAWLRVEAGNIEADGLGRYVVRVDRGDLAEGFYTAAITVTGDVDSVEIPVSMEVGERASNADVGQVFVVLRDAATNAVVAETRLAARGGVYRYSFEAIDDGHYTITAGTDADNDGRICDAGESCGAYAVPVALAADRGLVDFGVEWAIPIGGERSSAAAVSRSSADRDAKVVADF